MLLLHIELFLKKKKQGFVELVCLNHFSCCILLTDQNSLSGCLYLLLKKNFTAPFYGWGSTASRLEPLQGGSLLFTTKFSEIPGTHFTDLGRMKG